MWETQQSSCSICQGPGMPDVAARIQCNTIASRSCHINTPCGLDSGSINVRSKFDDGSIQAESRLDQCSIVADLLQAPSLPMLDLIQCAPHKPPSRIGNAVGYVS